MILVGDNLYGSERPQDFKKKFEDPYKPLLDAGREVLRVARQSRRPAGTAQLQAVQHGRQALLLVQARYKQSVRFFALESSYLEPEQVAWFEQELKGSNSDWKIPYFHHPPYSSGERHGSDPQIRSALEPLFLKYNVSVVFTGHDHFYERTKPQKGIVYFVVRIGRAAAEGQHRQRDRADRGRQRSGSGF